MRSTAEIKERIFIFNKELEKHNKNPDGYEESFTEILKDSIRLLEWVLQE